MSAKVLISDPLSEDGVKILRDAGFQVDERPGLSEDELCGIVGGYDCLIIRSGTKATAKVIDAGANLKVIGRAGVGVDNIDVQHATDRGVLVMNTPSANILSAAEHSCAMLLALARNIPFAHESMHKGEWKRSKYTGVELNGKVLGIIGVGRVGGEVAKRMKAFNMTMIGYDPFLPKEVADAIGVRLTTLEEVLTTADFMTIHTPLLPETRNMISLPQFKMMKPNARIANVARGGIVEENDLYTALKEGIIAGAAFDVWVDEPLNEQERRLLELDNLVTTPHLGASTVEAQERVAVEIAENVAKFLAEGVVANAINAPRGSLDAETEPFLPLAERMGRAIQQMVGNNPLNKLEMSYCGGLAGKQTKLLTITTVIGYLSKVVGTVNLINALPVAKQKGVEISETSNDTAKDYASVVEAKITYAGRTRSIRGTVIGGVPRLVGVDSYAFDIPMSGDMMLLTYKDGPGIIGTVGNALGEAGINIAQMTVGRDGPDAMMCLTVDHDIPDEIVAKVASLVGTEDVKFLDLVERCPPSPYGT